MYTRPSPYGRSSSHQKPPLDVDKLIQDRDSYKLSFQKAQDQLKEQEQTIDKLVVLSSKMKDELEELKRQNVELKENELLTKKQSSEQQEQQLLAQPEHNQQKSSVNRERSKRERYDIIFSRGQREVVKKEYKKAMNCFKDAICLIPEVEAFKALAGVQEELGQYEEAIYTFQQAMTVVECKKSLQYLQLYSSLAWVKFLYGQLTTAKEDFDNIITGLEEYRSTLPADEKDNDSIISCLLAALDGQMCACRDLGQKKQSEKCRARSTHLRNEYPHIKK